MKPRNVIKSCHENSTGAANYYTRIYLQLQSEYIYIYIYIHTHIRLLKPTNQNLYILGSNYGLQVTNPKI